MNLEVSVLKVLWKLMTSGQPVLVAVHVVNEKEPFGVGKLLT